MRYWSAAGSHPLAHQISLDVVPRGGEVAPTHHHVPVTELNAEEAHVPVLRVVVDPVRIIDWPHLLVTELGPQLARNSSPPSGIFTRFLVEALMQLERVISGGQTGADRAALAAARLAGIATGGWMPKGFRAHDGLHPEFAEQYGVREHHSKRYPPRTALNVKESDATLRFATHWDSPGELLTQKMCERYGRPQLEVTPGGQSTPADVLDWLARNNVRVLNVAGNAERTSPGIEVLVTAFLAEVFTLLRARAAAESG